MSAGGSSASERRGFIGMYCERTLDGKVNSARRDSVDLGFSDGDVLCSRDSVDVRIAEGLED
jgi:hypothetical protein